MPEEDKKKDDRNLEDWVPVHDSIGVTHWLPPMRRSRDGRRPEFL